MPNEHQDGTTGQFVENFPDQAFVDAVADLGPMAASRDVAELVGCTHATANMRLRDLGDEGQLDKQQRAGANLWTVADDSAGAHAEGEASA